MSKDKCWSSVWPFTNSLEVTIIPLPASTKSPTSSKATPASTGTTAPTSSKTTSSDSLVSLVDLYRAEGMEALYEKVNDILASPEATKELIRSAEREKFKDEPLVISKDLVARLRLTMIVSHNLEREARELYPPRAERVKGSS